MTKSICTCAVTTKILGFLLGLQGGSTKCSCFPSLWDSLAESEHYHIVCWCVPKKFYSRNSSVTTEHLANKEKVLLPPFHITLDLNKQFVNTPDFKSGAYQEIRFTFPKLSDAKAKARIFGGRQIQIKTKCGSHFTEW